MSYTEKIARALQLDEKAADHGRKNLPASNALAVIAVAGAWAWQSLKSGTRPAPSMLSVMVITSALAAIAIAGPHIEPVLVRGLQQS